MATKIQLKKFKEKLIKLGYKKKDIGDGSGFWFQKRVKLFKGHTNKKFYIYVDPDDGCNHYQIQYKELGVMQDFLHFKNFKQLSKFVKKNRTR